MADETHDNGGGSTATTRPGPTRRPGLIRSIAHRLAGDRLALPVEGRLAAVRPARRGWLNSEPLTPEGLRGRVVLVDFWTYTCVNWLRTLPYLRAWAAKYARRRADRRRGAHAGVRVRAQRRQRDRAVARPRGRVPGGGRQRLRRLARVRQPLLAGDVPRRRRGPHPVPPLRRGRVRHDRDGDPAAPARCRRRGHRPGSRDGRAARPRGGGRLADAALARDVPRLRPEQRVRLGDVARGSTGPTGYAAPARLPLNYWDLSGTWTVARARRACSTSRAAGSPSSSRRATSTS